jgi:exodeoxyribonuclease V alpha subunit
MSPEAAQTLSRVTGHLVPAAEPPRTTVSGSPIGDGVVVLRRVHRFGGSIGRLAEAIQRGDSDAVLALLAAGEPDVRWIPTDVASEATATGLDVLRTESVASGRRLVEAARAGRAADAIEALGAFRLLCAHRRGPEGVNTWMAIVERWLASEVEGIGGDGTWYAGRPLLVTENDYSVVVAAANGRVVAAFERGGEVVEVSPTRLAAVETVYAMTVHKAQGSQFATVAVLLPAPDSPILTRELLYTAVTRAQTKLFVVGTEDSVRAAVERPIARASGLRRALWGEAR